MTTPSRGIKNHLSRKEVVEIHRFLDNPDVLRRNVDNPKLFYYMNGWDDAKVAEKFTKELDGLITTYNVAGLRDELFGHLARAQRADRSEALEALEALEDKVGQLEAAIVRLDKIVAGKGDAIHALQTHLSKLLTRLGEKVPPSVNSVDRAIEDF